MNKTPIAISWSGGKDSTLMLHKILQDTRYEVISLHTAISAETKRVSMHGVSIDLMTEQANSIGLPLELILIPSDTSNSSYEKSLKKYYDALYRKGIKHIGFGDIFLEDLKAYRDKLLLQSNLTGIYPLWKIDTQKLSKEFLKLKYQTMICCSNQALFATSICGKIYSEQLLSTLSADVDVCGENGEFHTFAFEGPIFKHKINIKVKEVVTKSYDHQNDDGTKITSHYEFADLRLD